MDTIIDLKNTCEDFAFEVEIQPVVVISKIKDDRQLRIAKGIASVDEQLLEIESELGKLNTDIDKLTNYADGIDYAVAVTSGVITGIIDATIVGEWNFKEAKNKAYEEINNKVIGFAKKQPDYIPYCTYTTKRIKIGKGKREVISTTPRRKPKDADRLETAIEFLEWKFPLPGDGAYRDGTHSIGGKTHRLDDLCHHPTLVGLVCCIIVQFSGHSLYVNKYGKDVNIPVTVNEYGNFVGKNPVTKMFAGVINWFITCAKTITNRTGHLMSDMATPAGLPCSFLSIITELASIPCFRNAEFLTKLRQAFVNGIGTGKGQIDLGAFNKLFERASSKLDMSTQNAVKYELRRQAMPVIINEVLVRGVYFIRRFIGELKEKEDITFLDWSKVLPFNNRTIVRMMTIATGTFTAVDMADAAISSATKSVDTASFFSNMLLKVNFVGVGRFAIAVCSDVGLGISRNIKQDERIRIQNEQFLLLDAKVFYKQEEMWISAEETYETLEQAYRMMENTVNSFSETVICIKKSMQNIGKEIPKIEQKNPKLTEEMSNVLKWG